MNSYDNDTTSGKNIYYSSYCYRTWGRSNVQRRYWSVKQRRKQWFIYAVVNSGIRVEAKSKYKINIIASSLRGRHSHSELEGQQTPQARRFYERPHWYLEQAVYYAASSTIKQVGHPLFESKIHQSALLTLVGDQPASLTEEMERGCNPSRF